MALMACWLTLDRPAGFLADADPITVGLYIAGSAALHVRSSASTTGGDRGCWYPDRQIVENLAGDHDPGARNEGWSYCSSTELVPRRGCDWRGGLRYLSVRAVCGCGCGCGCGGCESRKKMEDTLEFSSTDALVCLL